MAESSEYAKKKIIFMLIFTLVVFLLEIVVAYSSNSQALAADAFHMLSDIIALTIAFVSLRLAEKNTKAINNRYGWSKAEDLGAMINAVFLCALCFSLIVESLKRFYEPEPIRNPLLVLIVGSVGLVANIIGLYLFRDHGEEADKQQYPISYYKSLSSSESLKRLRSRIKQSTSGVQSDVQSGVPSSENAKPKEDKLKRLVPNTSSMSLASEGGQSIAQKGVFLHILADFFGSVIVCVSAAILLWTDWEYAVYIDPSLTLISVCLIFLSLKPLFVNSATVLLNAVPSHINVDNLEKDFLERFPTIQTIHDFHVWQLTGDTIIATGYITIETKANDWKQDEYMSMVQQIKTFFHQAKIQASIFEIEFTRPMTSDPMSSDIKTEIVNSSQEQGVSNIPQSTTTEICTDIRSL